jgi:hypothetical protein
MEPLGHVSEFGYIRKGLNHINAFREKSFNVSSSHLLPQISLA